MDDYESLSHTEWTCKYHVVLILKGRRKTLYLELRRHLNEVFRRLALQRESKVEEGHLMPAHVHMLLSIRGLMEYTTPGSAISFGVRPRNLFACLGQRF
jgi:REP element-mobilizing transposase RayT